MSEQHTIKTLGEKEPRLAELLRDTHGDTGDHATEIEQMFTAVRQQLTELTVSIRSDLEELRRLASDPPTDRAEVSRHVIDPRSGVEIERKFIVNEPPRELDDLHCERISQGYVAIGEGGLEVRVRRRGENATLTVKNRLGRTRREEEIALRPEQFKRLWPLTEGRRVEKVRHLIPTEDGLTIELDRYAEELEGLTTAEVEFDSEARAEAFAPPQWFGPEVTDDPRYRNARLACDGAPPAPRKAPEPFRLQRREAATKGIRRIVCGQIDAAIDELEAGSPQDRDEAVHASRRHFKRVRATARLVRDELPVEAYRRESTAFGDYGRRLSSARDSRVLLETLDALRARYASEIPSAAFLRLRAALAEDHRAAEELLREDAGASILAELRAARTRVAAWRLRHDAVSALAPGFERIYRRGRRALDAASNDPTDERFHELRKRSKDLWHAAQILRPAAPKTMKKLAARAHRLSDLVGDDHDLAVLAQRADQRPGCLPEEGEAALMHALIARRRRQIQRDAIELAQRTFAAKPRKLAEHIAHARAAQVH